MKKIRIGSVELTGVPGVVAVVAEKLSPGEILKIKQRGADIVELRVDKIQNKSMEEIIKIIKAIKKSHLPVICTIRKDVWERKYGLDGEKNRMEYFLELIPFVDAIDIEFEAKEIRGKVISVARKRKRAVIFSFHDFKKIPEEDVLKNIFNVFRRSGADVFKVAGYAWTIDDAMRLMAFVKKVSRKYPVIGIAMGRAGEFTRIYGGFFGSCLTYASLSKKVAPGQLPLSKLRKEIDRIYY